MSSFARPLIALVLLPLAAQAQSFQPGRLPAETRDSFDIVYQGQAIGAFTISVSRTGENFTLVGEARLPRMAVQELDSIVFHGTSLAPISFANTQSMQGMVGASRVSIANGKATGTVQRPGPAGMQTTPMDVTVAPGLIADGAEVALLPTVDLSDGLEWSFQTFDSETGKTKSYRATVGPREQVTVPAGTFDAYRVDLASEDNVTLFITTAEPRKIVLIRLETAQMEMRRAK